MPLVTFTRWLIVGVYRGFSVVEEAPVGTFTSEEEASFELDWARRTWGHKYTHFEVRSIDYQEWEDA